MKEYIVYEDKDILVCHKPAGLAVQTGKLGQKDLVSEIKNYLGSPYLGLIHRLDQPVEGLLVFAKTPFAAKELSRQVAEHILNKKYVAVVCGKGFLEETTLENYLVKDNKTNMSKVAKTTASGAKRAELSVKTLQYNETEDTALVEVALVTGRHHQIRVQLAHAGFPLLGDSKYGTENSIQKSKACGVKNVALCACSLAFWHPRTGKEMDFAVKPKGEIFRKGVGDGKSNRTC